MIVITHMSDLAIQIVAGLIVILIAGWLGLGGKTVTIQSNTTKKTGKKMILISWVLIILGLYLGGSANWDLETAKAGAGASSLILGFLLLIVGRIVVWFQSN